MFEFTSKVKAKNRGKDVVVYTVSEESWKDIFREWLDYKLELKRVGDWMFVVELDGKKYLVKVLF